MAKKRLKKKWEKRALVEKLGLLQAHEYELENRVKSLEKDRKNLIMSLIDFREEMMKDIRFIENSGETETEGYRDLVIHMENITEQLDDYKVSIIERCTGGFFDTAYQMPLKRVDVEDEELHNKVIEAYNDAYTYELNGRTVALKKMRVAVCILKK